MARYNIRHIPEDYGDHSTIWVTLYAWEIYHRRAILISTIEQHTVSSKKEGRIRWYIRQCYQDELKISLHTQHHKRNIIEEYDRILKYLIYLQKFKLINKHHCTLSYLLLCHYSSNTSAPYLTNKWTPRW